MQWPHLDASITVRVGFEGGAALGGAHRAGGSSSRITFDNDLFSLTLPGSTSPTGAPPAVSPSAEAVGRAYSSEASSRSRTFSRSGSSFVGSDGGAGSSSSAASQAGLYHQQQPSREGLSGEMTQKITYGPLPNYGSASYGLSVREVASQKIATISRRLASLSVAVKTLSIGERSREALIESLEAVDQLLCQLSREEEEERSMEALGGAVQRVMDRGQLRPVGTILNGTRLGALHSSSGEEARLYGGDGFSFAAAAGEEALAVEAESATFHHQPNLQSAIRIIVRSGRLCLLLHFHPASASFGPRRSSLTAYCPSVL